MATIRNAIILQDHMSSTLERIARGARVTEKSMAALDAAMRRYERAAVMNHKTMLLQREVARERYEMSEKLAAQRHHQWLEQEEIRHSNRMEEIARKAAQQRAAAWAKSFSSIGTSLLSLSSLIYILRNIKEALEEVTSAADTARANIARIGLFNTSEYSNEELYRHIYQVAKQTRADIDDTASLVIRALTSDIFTGPGAVQGATKFASIINKIMAIDQATSEQRERAILQLSQGLSSGVLQGENLRSIREQSQYLARVLAQGLATIDEKYAGLSSGDLKKLGSEGVLTAETVVRAFLNMSDIIEEQFQKMPKTFDQFKTSIGTTWKMFVTQLNSANGPLTKLNEKLWQFAEWLTSPPGLEFLEAVARGISVLVDGLILLMDTIAKVYNFFKKHWELTAGLLTSLATVATICATAIFIKFLKALWPVLLLMAVITLVIYVLLKLGITAEQIVGSIIGAIYWLVAVIWDALIAVLLFVIDLIIYILGLAGTTIQLIAQLLTWLGLTILGILVNVWNVIYTISATIYIAIAGTILGIWYLFATMIASCLELINYLAKGIDFVFGSNLSNKVEGWISGIRGSVDKLANVLDIGGAASSIGDQWVESNKEIIKMYKGEGKYDDLNILDKIQDTENWTYGTINKINAFGESKLIDPVQAFKNGYAVGEGIVDAVGGYFKGIDTSYIDNLAKDNVEDGEYTIKGGHLDSVSDVELSDEDLKLLREMASREFLINVQTITPTANVQFGDVHETADVNKLWEAIQDMIAEQLATTLIVD